MALESHICVTRAKLVTRIFILNLSARRPLGQAFNLAHVTDHNGLINVMWNYVWLRQLGARLLSTDS